MFRHVHGTTAAVEKQCVSVALGIHHAIDMRYTVICGLSASAIFFHIISQMARIKKKKKLFNMKSVFRLPLQLLSETFLILRRNE
jgi:hypothetical protein